MDNDIVLEKCVDAVRYGFVQILPIRNRKRCPVLLKMAILLNQMKHETNRQIAIDL